MRASWRAGKRRPFPDRNRKQRKSRLDAVRADKGGVPAGSAAEANGVVAEADWAGASKAKTGKKKNANVFPAVEITHIRSN